MKIKALISLFFSNNSLNGLTQEENSKCYILHGLKTYDVFAETEFSLQSHFSVPTKFSHLNMSSLFTHLYQHKMFLMSILSFPLQVEWPKHTFQRLFLTKKESTLKCFKVCRDPGTIGCVSVLKH